MNLSLQSLTLSFMMYRLGKGLPWVLYHGVHKDLRINVVCPGRDAALGKDLSMLSKI